MNLKPRLRAMAADRRDNPVVRSIARNATRITNAVNNQYNWEFDRNGELWTAKWALDRSAGAVFDVGANEGQWATAFMQHRRGRALHCFEPVPPVFERLESLMQGQSNVQLNMLGMGAEVGSVRLNYNPAVTTVTSRYNLPAPYRSQDDQYVDINITTGDDYCKAHDIERIALLKIDVEGMEFEVLQGFDEMFSGRRISTIQFEYGIGYVGARTFLGDVCSYLGSHGLDLFRQFPTDLEPFVYDETAEDFRPRNYVAALPEDRIGVPSIV